MTRKWPRVSAGASGSSAIPAGLSQAQSLPPPDPLAATWKVSRIPTPINQARLSEEQHREQVAPDCIVAQTMQPFPQPSAVSTPLHSWRGNSATGQNDSGLFCLWTMYRGLPSGVDPPGGWQMRPAAGGGISLGIAKRLTAPPVTTGMFGPALGGNGFFLRRPCALEKMRMQGGLILNRYSRTDRTLRYPSRKLWKRQPWV